MVGNLSHAVDMLRRSTRAKAWDGHTEAQLHERMLSVMFSKSQADIQALMTNESPRRKQLQREAYILHAECLSASWVRQHNELRGLVAVRASVRPSMTS